MESQVVQVFLNKLKKGVDAIRKMSKMRIHFHGTAQRSVLISLSLGNIT